MMPQSSCRAHSTLSMMVVALFVLGSFSRDTPILWSALTLSSVSQAQAQLWAIASVVLVLFAQDFSDPT